MRVNIPGRDVLERVFRSSEPHEAHCAAARTCQFMVDADGDPVKIVLPAFARDFNRPVRCFPRFGSVPKTVADGGKKTRFGLNDARVVAAYGLTRIWLAHDGGFAQRGSRRFKLSRDDAKPFIDPIVPRDLIGEPAHCSYPGSEAARLSGYLAADRGRRFFDARSQIGCDHFETFQPIPLNRSDREVSLPGMPQMIVGELACDHRNAFDEFLTQTERPARVPDALAGR